MGGEDSKIKTEIIERIKEFPYRNEKAISEQEFVSELFRGIDLSHINAPIGPTFISGTYIIKSYYNHLLDKVILVRFSIVALLARIRPLAPLKNCMMIQKKPSNVSLPSFRFIQTDPTSRTSLHH